MTPDRSVCTYDVVENKYRIDIQGDDAAVCYRARDADLESARSILCMC